MVSRPHCDLVWILSTYLSRQTGASSEQMKARACGWQPVWSSVLHSSERGTASPDCCGPAGSADASPSTARPCRRSSAAGRGCSVWSGPGRRPRSGPPERRGAAGETDPWSWRWVMQELSRLGLYIEEERCYQRHIRERRRQEITVQTGDITQLSKRDTHTLKLLTETTPPGQLQPHLYVTW